MCCGAEYSASALCCQLLFVLRFTQGPSQKSEIKVLQTLEPALKAKQGSVGVIGAGGSWQLLGQLVLVILEQTQREPSKPFPGLSLPFLLPKASHRVCVPCAPVRTCQKPAVCSETARVCAAHSHQAWMVLYLSHYLPKTLSGAEVPSGGDSFF